MSMMSDIGSNKVRVIVGLVVIITILFFYLFIDLAWTKYQDDKKRMEQLEPRISRLLGVEKSYELLQKANQDIEVQLTQVAYPVVEDTAVTGAEMQRAIRDIMNKAGMSVSGSQILPMKAEEGYDAIHLEINVKGTVEGLEEVLIGLRELRPNVIIETLNIKPVRQREGEHQLTARFRLLSLRLQL